MRSRLALISAMSQKPIAVVHQAVMAAVLVLLGVAKWFPNSILLVLKDLLAKFKAQSKLILVITLLK